MNIKTQTPKYRNDRLIQIQKLPYIKSEARIELEKSKKVIYENEKNHINKRVKTKSFLINQQKLSSQNKQKSKNRKPSKNLVKLPDLYKEAKINHLLNE